MKCQFSLISNSSLHVFVAGVMLMEAKSIVYCFDVCVYTHVLFSMNEKS